MRRLWPIFALMVTVAVAILFVVTTLKPEWLGKRPSAMTVQEAGRLNDEVPQGTVSYRDAARKAVPAVVHIYTTQEIKKPSHPLLQDLSLIHI